MLKIKNTIVTGFEAAIRGMRNPFLSYERSDSWFRHSDLYYHKITGEIRVTDELIDPDDYTPDYILGPNDKDLMKRLASSGSDHAKYRRFIGVTADVTAPLYWWKEHDQYKVGTVTNSCSTMHKIAAKEFTMEDFSCEHLGYFDPERYDDDQPYLGTAVEVNGGDHWYPVDVLADIIVVLNHNREMYLETKDKRYWWQMIQLLPSSYNQRRTIMLNYEVLANIYHARRNHRLDEWHTFCDWIETLPESWIIIGKSEDDRVNELYSSHVMLSREFCFPTSDEKAEANTENLVDDGK